MTPQDRNRKRRENPVRIEFMKNISTDTKSCIQLGNLVGGYGYCNFEAYNRVYSIYGCSPTIITRYDTDAITGFKIGYYEQAHFGNTTKKTKSVEM